MWQFNTRIDLMATATGGAALQNELRTADLVGGYLGSQKLQIAAYDSPLQREMAFQ